MGGLCDGRGRRRGNGETGLRSCLNGGCDRGEAILRQCAAMETAAADLERIVAGRDALLTGSVRLATTEGLAYQLIGPAIEALREAHPELRLDVIAGARSLDIARR